MNPLIRRHSLLITNENEGIDGYVTRGLVLHLDGIKNHRSGHVASTSVWQDLSGGHHDLTGTGTFNVSDNSYIFDGTKYFRRNGDSILWNIAPTIAGGTLEVVFKWGDSSNTGVIVAMYTDDTKQSPARGNGKGLWTRPYSSQLVTSIRELDEIDCNGVPLPDTNKIVQYSVQYTPGQDASSATIKEGVTQTQTNCTGTLTTKKDLCVGGRHHITGNSHCFIGKIYAIRLYSTILTQEEVAINFMMDKERFNF